MLTQEDDVDVHALARQGWTVSAIARHLGHDRKTVRGYLSGGRAAGVRVAATTDPLEAFVPYLRQRLVDDPHVWATVLFDEAAALGFDRSYPRFTHGLRAHRLRPHCEPCSASTGRDHAVIDHPLGEEVQWDWVELPDPPAAWAAGVAAHLLVGALSGSGKWRGVLADSEDSPHLIEALHAVSERLGGLPRRWRFDRMATVTSPATGRVTASFAAVAKHYGVHVDLCPSRHGNRKGTVEKANHSAAQRWWRTLPDDATIAAAQASLDGFCVRVGDARPRKRAGQATTVAAVAALEGLAPLPPAFPAILTVSRVVTAQALVAFAGNHYSVPPGLAGTPVMVTHRLGQPVLDITTAAGTVLARRPRAVDGAVVTGEHHPAGGDDVQHRLPEAVGHGHRRPGQPGRDRVLVPGERDQGLGGDDPLHGQCGRERRRQRREPLEGGQRPDSRGLPGSFPGPASVTRAQNASSDACASAMVVSSGRVRHHRCAAERYLSSQVRQRDVRCSVVLGAVG